MKELPKAIRQALKKAKLSPALSTDFSQFLNQHPDWESQTLYLLNDKNQKIEEVVQELFGVPINKQSTWTKEPLKKTANIQTSELNFKSPSQHNVHVRHSFKEWKQENGFFPSFFESGNTYIFIRIKPFVDENFKQQFCWTFSKAKYGKAGWRIERNIKNINSALANNKHSPGENVKTYLENNPLLMDKSVKFLSDFSAAREHIPNPFVLDSCCSQTLLYLLFGHPLLFFNGSQKTLVLQKYRVAVELHYVAKEGYRVVFSTFHLNKKTRFTFDFQKNREHIFFIGKEDKALLVKNAYFSLQALDLEVSQLQAVTQGISVLDEDWSRFLKQWKSEYPELEIKKTNESQELIPEFTIGSLMGWEFWLQLERTTSQKPEFLPKFQFSSKMQRNSYHRVGVNVKNVAPYNSKDLDFHHFKDLEQLLHYTQIITVSKKDKEFYLLNPTVASQFLQLFKNYPYIYNSDGEPFFAKDKKIYFALTIKKSEDYYHQYFLQGSLYTKVKIKEQIQWKPFPDNKEEQVKVIGLAPGFIFYKNRVYEMNRIFNGNFIKSCLTGILANEREISDFYANALPFLKARGVKIWDNHGLLRISALFNYTIQGKMTVQEIKGILVGELHMIMKTDIGEFEYPIYEGEDEFQKRFDNQRLSITRNKQMEMELHNIILEHGWVKEETNIYSMNEVNALNFVLNILPNQNEGLTVVYREEKRLKRWKTSRITPKVSVNIKHNIDWFMVDLKFDDYHLDVEQIISIWREGKDYIDLGKEKGLALIDQNWMKQYAPIFNRLVHAKYQSDPLVRRDEKNLLSKNLKEYKKLRVTKNSLGLLEELHKIFSTKKRKEWHPYKIIPRKIPATVQAKLREYQKEGVNWLCFLRKNDFGGILADDMGLGKTLQALTFFEIVRTSRALKKCSKRAHLVVCPTSVVTNWQEEMIKFTPKLKYYLYHGPKRKKEIFNLKKIDVIITSYSLLQKEIDFFLSMNFDVVLLDEAQNIKNANSKTAKAVCQLNSIQRLSLTGTPMENDITEFWSQFNFLMPSLLGTLKDFHNLYVQPKYQKKLKKKEFDYSLLRKQTKPFILRRLKANVAKSLPPKTEQIIYCEMYPAQRKIYNAVLLAEKKSLFRKIEENKKNNQIKISFFEALLKLRQICCDPRLSKLIVDNPPPSAKLDLFLSHVEEIVSEGHRILVFSQFVKMLNLMHQPLKKRNIHFLQLDGSTNNRQASIDKFQNDSHYSVFLISLKAGGTGLNLTAADYVIHYDLWWNPAVENQASDRAYRIGQDKHVFIYKLITKDSVEEKILTLQSQKLSATENVIDEFQDFKGMLAIDSIKEILS